MRVPGAWVKTAKRIPRGDLRRPASSVKAARNVRSSWSRRSRSTSKTWAAVKTTHNSSDNAKLSRTATVRARGPEGGRPPVTRIFLTDDYAGREPSCPIARRAATRMISSEVEFLRPGSYAREVFDHRHDRANRATSETAILAPKSSSSLGACRLWTSRPEAGVTWFVVAGFFALSWCIYLAFFLPGDGSQATADYSWKYLSLEDSGLNSRFKGKTVFLNVWATWCPPCVEGDAFDRSRLAANPRLKDVEFVCVSVDAESSTIRNFLSSRLDH